MNDKRQLLCTFASVKDYKSTIEELRSFYNIYNNKFFVFYSVKNPDDIFITYNILNDGAEFPKFQNTISIHRKKQTNTLYTLNAMNQIIKDENNGVFDKSYSVNWTLYESCIIITGDPSIRVLNIKMLDVIN